MGERQFFTKQDEQQLQLAGDELRKLGCQTSGSPGANQNSDRILDYLVANSGVQVTIANILAFVKQNHHQFNWDDDSDPFGSPVKLEYDRLAKSFSEQTRNLIAATLGRFGYATSPESDLLFNWNLVAKSLLAHRYSTPTLDQIKTIISNLGNSQQGQSLRKTTERKFDPEAVARTQGFRPDPEKGWVKDKKEDRRNMDEATYRPQDGPPEGWVKPYHPSPHAQKKVEEPVAPQPEVSLWETMFRNRLRDIRSVVVRSEVEQSLLKHAQENGTWRQMYGKLNAYLTTTDPEMRRRSLELN